MFHNAIALKSMLTAYSKNLHELMVGFESHVYVTDLPHMTALSWMFITGSWCTLESN
jgi:hypothetical protein